MKHLVLHICMHSLMHSREVHKIVYKCFCLKTWMCLLLTETNHSFATRFLECLSSKAEQI